MKTTHTDDGAQLNAFADAWSQPVKDACAAEPSPELIARVHCRAAQNLGACRRRLFVAHIRPFLVSAAAAAALCAATWVAIRPAAEPPQLHPLAALDGMLLLATAATEEPAAEAGARNGTDTAVLARRLLELQGFIDTEAETMLTYL